LEKVRKYRGEAKKAILRSMGKANLRDVGSENLRNMTAEAIEEFVGVSSL
jgi:hypothetical protein